MSYLDRDRKLDLFKPHKSHELFKKYSSSINSKDELKSSSLYTNYVNNHVGTTELLSALSPDQPAPADSKAAAPAKVPYIKFANGDNLQTRIAAIPDEAQKEEISSLFTDALSLSPIVTEAQKKFNAKTEGLNNAIMANPNFDSSAVASILKEIQYEASSSLKTQQNEEIRRITALFDDPIKAELLRTRLGLANGPDNDELATFKTQTLQALTKKHEKESGDINEKMNAEANALHKDSQNERDRINLLAVLYKDSARMKRIIDAIAAEKRKAGQIPDEQSSAEIGLNGVTGIATFKGITVADLAKYGPIRSLTGRKITQTVDGDKSTFQFQVPSLINFNYHFGYYKQLKTDLFLMAMALRATGKEDILVTVTHTDDDQARKLASFQYEAALKAGFAPDKIKLNINGKEESAENVFGDKQNFLAKIKKDFTTREAEKTSFREQAPLGASSELKRQIQMFVEAKENQAEAKNQNNDPDPNAPQL